MNLTLRQIRAFSAVAREGSFTVASARLHLTQSAVSVLIGQLERELGLRLFDRTSRRVALTAAGLEFRVVAEKVLSELELGIARSRDLVALQRGRVVVAATPLMSSILLPAAIAACALEHPGIEVVLRDSQAARIPARIRDGEVDFGIYSGAQGDRELQATPLMVDALMLACPRGHALAERVAGVAWRELAERPFIAFERDNALGQLVAEQLAAAGVNVRVVHEVAFLSTALGMVEAGIGLAVMPSYARPATAGRAMVMRRLIRPVVKRETAIVTSRFRSLSPPASAFVQFLTRHLASPAIASAMNASGHGAARRSSLATPAK